MTEGERLRMVEHFDSVTAAEGAAQAVPLPGILQALDQLYDAGIRLGIATNDSTSGAEKTVLALGIAALHRRLRLRRGRERQAGARFLFMPSAT
jgi:phosphoglycolate phosphatase